MYCSSFLHDVQCPTKLLCLQQDSILKLVAPNIILNQLHACEEKSIWRKKQATIRQTAQVDQRAIIHHELTSDRPWLTVFLIDPYWNTEVQVYDWKGMVEYPFPVAEADLFVLLWSLLYTEIAQYHRNEDPSLLCLCLFFTLNKITAAFMLPQYVIFRWGMKCNTSSASSVTFYMRVEQHFPNNGTTWQ